MICAFCASVTAPPAQLALRQMREPGDVAGHQIGPELTDAARGVIGVLVEIRKARQRYHARRRNHRIGGREALQIDGHAVRQLIQHMLDQALVGGPAGDEAEHGLARHADHDRQAGHAQLVEAAQQFEAMLVRQMLAAARSDGLGDALTGSGAMDNFRAMQDDRFAQIAATRGSFGLARMLESRMAKAAGTGG